MIYVHPAIVSSNTNSNLVPGLCKVLERHVLIYETDRILTRIRRIHKLVRGAKIAAIGAILYKSYKKFKKAKARNESEVVSTISKVASDLKSGPKLETPNLNVLSIEPTWSYISSSKGPILFGVKVVPFYLDKNDEVTRLIKNDILLKKSGQTMEIFMKQMKGKLLSTWYKRIRKTPDKNIIFNHKFFGRNIFMVLNKMDLENDLTRNKDIANLQNLGWSSFVLCDDIAKKVFFCMKEYKGFCSSLNYRFIYSALGTTTSKIFDDLEDVKRSSPFFRMTTRSSKLVGESFTENIMEDLENELIINGLY